MTKSTAARDRARPSQPKPERRAPEGAELPVALGVIELAPAAGATVDLDHQPGAGPGREQVDDAGVKDDLPPKPHAELAASQRLPEARLRSARLTLESEAALHDASRLTSQRTTSRDIHMRIHDDTQDAGLAPP